MPTTNDPTGPWRAAGPARRRFADALRRGVDELGGDRAAEAASGVGKASWYDAKTGRSIPDLTWPAMRLTLQRLPPARTGVRDWDALRDAARAEPDPWRPGRMSAAGRPATGRAAPPPLPSWSVPRQLPPAGSIFTARRAELAALDRVLRPERGGAAPAVAAVVGPPGVGKTALAISWAHRAAARYPDGVLHTDLRGFGPGQPVEPEVVLSGWLRAVGRQPDPGLGPEHLAALLRTALTGRRVLIVLDNAATEQQLRLLLPAEPGAAALITSRHGLPGLAIEHGAEIVPLEPFTGAESLGLLRDVVGLRAVREPGAAAALAELGGGLPLAVRIIAADARRQPAEPLSAVLASFAVEASGESRLDRLGSDDPRSDPRTVFSWSVGRLDEAAAAAFRRLGLHPGDSFDPWAAAALIGTPVEAARRVLRGLHRAHLVAATGVERYRLHDLLHVYAAELADRHEPPGAAAAAREQLLSHYLRRARQADLLVEPYRYHPPLPVAEGPEPPFPDRAAALAWLDRECATLVAVCRLDAAELDPLRWRLAYEMKGYLFLTKRTPEFLAAHRAALAAAERSGDRLGEAMTRSNLGVALHENGDDGAALLQYELAGEGFAAAGDLHGVSNTLGHRATVHRRRGELAEAQRLGEEALTYYRRAGAERYVAIALRGIASTEVAAGRFAAAERHLAESLELCARLGLYMDAARAWQTLGRALLALRRPEDGAAAFGSAIEAARSCGSRFEEALGLRGLGDVAAATGDPAAARTRWQAALAMLEELGSPRATEVAAALDLLGAAVTPPPADR
ncbi:tetratricopeptide repeat protein [Dactylosporangium sp. NPDC005572]|uniref:tetratricopeptide repeat protein n=1 Tax=Dactylosporangium sp. NPDC005572 TaxID=3156889 RepID=UPI0033AA3F55